MSFLLLRQFLETIDLDSLERIPDTISDVDETGEADVAFRARVSTGAPVLVGILLEHKSGRDDEVLNQISRYVHSIMKRVGEKRRFDGLPTMAVIFTTVRSAGTRSRTSRTAIPNTGTGPCSRSSAFS